MKIGFIDFQSLGKSEAAFLSLNAFPFFPAR